MAPVGFFANGAAWGCMNLVMVLPCLVYLLAQVGTRALTVCHLLY